jgi:thiamine pyrophosphate-dependent acetolactate synthase large subunit-like protein
MATPETKVEELMDGRFIALHAEDNQEVANEAFKMNNRVAIGVRMGGMGVAIGSDVGKKLANLF